MKIIGVELRVNISNERGNTTQKEIAMLPLNLSIEVDENQFGRMDDGGINGTIHTDHGDINFSVNVPRYYFTDKVTPGLEIYDRRA